MEEARQEIFEAWVDEKRRIVSFHAVPEARRYCAEERDFWTRVVELVLAGYRVQ